MQPSDLKAHLEAATPLPWPMWEKAPEGHNWSDYGLQHAMVTDVRLLYLLRNLAPLLLDLWEESESEVGDHRAFPLPGTTTALQRLREFQP